jgi:dienelactone hydrolase
VRRRVPAIAITVGLALVAGGAWVWSLFRTPGIPLPPGVVLRHERIRLTDRETAVDLYYPQGATQANVAVVAHGFPRNRRNMAGWGAMLAANGFVAAAPDLPTRAGHRRNGRAIAELLSALRSGAIPNLPRTVGRGALLGMSAGGLSTLFAASGNAAVGCWIGLDPVPGGMAGRRAAASLDIPCAVLRAEPAPWNEHGSAESIAEAVRGPLISLRVKKASHCDAEWPANRIGELACGKTDPARGAAFRHYALAAVRAALADDADAREQLRRAPADVRVDDVLTRDLDAFRPAGP